MPIAPSLSDPERVLHLVSGAPPAGDALRQALAHAAEADALVLLHDAVAAAVAGVKQPADWVRKLRRGGYVLGADLDARGFAQAPLREGWVRIEDAELVRLAVVCRSSVTWY